jgi:hypothetical protein
MSNTWWSNVRTTVKFCGRFLECVPRTCNEASFFSEKNSNGAASSKGKIVFFLLNLIVKGFLRLFRSDRTDWISSDAVVPRRMSVVLWFSESLGALESRARLERAFLGLLGMLVGVMRMGLRDGHGADHGCGGCGEWKR